MTAGWCSRTVRAAVFAAVCVLLAALGHVLMSGAHVPAWTLAAGVAGTGVVGWGLAGRERGLALVVTVVVVAQTALHQAFSYAQSVSGSTSMTSDMDMGATHIGAAHMDMGHMDHMGHTASHSMPSMPSMSFGMLAAHLLAALLSGLWLAYGERAAFGILRTVAGWLAAPCGCCSPCRPRRTAPASSCAVGAPSGRRGFSSLSTRSPLGAHPWGPLSSEDSR